MITFSWIQLSDIFQKSNMQQKNIKLCAAVIFWIGLTGCQTNSLKDIDGNEYKTVTIGDRVWMAENLKTTRYNDGTAIPMVSDNESWPTLMTPAYSWYNNDSTANKKTYGALYNWYAVSTNKLCPSGWHVPSDQEWVALTALQGGFGIAGGNLKESGTAHWKNPNTEATNKSGFTALPGGYLSMEGAFNYIGVSGYWWSSTEYNESSVLFWNLRYKAENLYKYRSEKYCGFSVRCIKDR